MQFDLSPIARLVDAKYERESALCAAGISAFVPALRFQESLARNSNELSEYREFISQVCRNHIVNDKVFSERLIASKHEAAERNKASGKYWDLRVTSLERHYWQETIEHPESMYERKRPFEIEMKGLFEKELVFFNHGYVSELKKQNRKSLSAKSVYVDLAGTALSEIGFRFDREDKSRGELAFNKVITPNLSLYLFVDMPNLLQRVGTPIRNETTGQWMSPSGPSLITWLQISDTASNSAQSRIMLDWLLPIREFPLGANWYCKFYELDELESLINMQVVMYRIVIAEIEQVLLGKSFGPYPL